MTPDTHHTFWDAQQGRYITIPVSKVIKPPLDDAELRRKAVVASGAVVGAILSVIGKAFLGAIGILVAIGVASHMGSFPGSQQVGNVIAIVTLVAVAIRLLYLGLRKLFRG